METFEMNITGRNYSFSLVTFQEDIFYTVVTEDITFKMALVDGDLKIINPAQLPPWILELEEKLSDAVFSRSANTKTYSGRS